MRLPLPAPIESRDGTVERDGLCKNLLIEQDEAEVFSTLRPGLSLNDTSSGAGNGLVEMRGDLLAVYGSSLILRGTPLLTLATLEDAFFDFAQST